MVESGIKKLIYLSRQYLKRMILLKKLISNFLISIVYYPVFTATTYTWYAILTNTVGQEWFVNWGYSLVGQSPVHFLFVQLPYQFFLFDNQKFNDYKYLKFVGLYLITYVVIGLLLSSMRLFEKIGFIPLLFERSMSVFLIIYLILLNFTIVYFHAVLMKLFKIKNMFS